MPPRQQPTVIVTGFWRSGTTWTQKIVAEALSARTVFEPFTPSHRTWRRLLNAHYDVAAGSLGHEGTSEEEETFWPGLDDGDRTPSEVFDYARRKFSGEHVDEVMDLEERPGDGSEAHLVAKAVRAPLSMRWLRTTFPKAVIVHVTRDPRAVRASMVRNDWWRFGDCDFARLLARQGDSRADMLGAITQSAHALKGAPEPRWHGFLWGAHEKASRTALAEFDPRSALRFNYGKIHGDPNEFLATVCAAIGDGDPLSARVRESSLTSWNRATGHAGADQVTGWRHELAESDATEVLRGVELVDQDLAAEYAD